MKLENKVAIVTGSSRGIGKAIARGLAKEGVNVVVNSNNSVSEGRAFADLLNSIGHTAKYIQSDVSNRKDVERLFSETKDYFGAVDILVNNVGVFYGLDIGRKQTFEEYSKIHRVNGWGVYLCSEVAGKYINGGNIINISSAWGICPNSDSILASGVKFEVEGYTKAFAQRYENKINVNGVAPGYVKTDLVKDNLDEEYIGKKMVDPSYISNAVIALLKGPVCSGYTLPVNN